MYVHFESLSEKHFSLIFEWFNLPHVQKFYSLRSWIYEEIALKMRPYITGEKKVSAFIVYIDDLAVASIQKCKIVNHPWPDMELSDEIMSTAAGIDFFIGPSAFLRKGLGSKIIHQFLSQEIWPFFDYCIVDPDVRNVASCKFFNKLGFMTHKIIQTKDALGGDVELNLMILKRG
ncbi:MAG: GNAT family N-acetyltransferase [Alphaproteobacteria bacterium]|nr:GNAT family N-acetyltransferase [Alphaproteobacteria bacterium]